MHIRNSTKNFKFNYTHTFHHLMDDARIFFKFFLLQYFKKVKVCNNYKDLFFL